jgi:hypothetical protein
MDLSKIFTRARMGALPRVRLPQIDEEAQARIDAVRAEADFYVRQRKGFVLAMMHAGKPFAARPVPARKRSKPTKNERHMARRKARVAFLAGTS